MFPTGFSHNLRSLFEREKGTLWRVNDQGNLAKVEGVCDWISYQWNKREEQAKVKTVIDAALNELNTYLEAHPEFKAAVKGLFNKKSDRGIGRLGKTLYNHKLTQTNTSLSKALLPVDVIRLILGGKHSIDIKHTSSESLSPEESIISLDLGNAVANKNLRLLIKRPRGEKYENVTTAINDVVARLDKALPQQITKAHTIAIKRIFDKNSSLGRMKREVFQRSAIAEGSRLEGILRPQLAEKRTALAIALKTSSTDQNRKSKIEKALMDLLMEEFLFMQDLGLDLEKNGDGGSGGARYARNRFGKKILVVKPGDEGPHGVNNPQWYARFKRLLISPKACLEGNSEPHAEVDSWSCDRHFNLWIVPPTALQVIRSQDFVGGKVKECSVQMFVDGCQTLGEHIGIPQWQLRIFRGFLRWKLSKNKDELFKKIPTALLERVGVHNFVIEDVDCHFENILMKIMGDIPLEIVTEEAADAFVDNFFKENRHQALLSRLLHSEVNQEGKRVYLIKHDGGSTHPHEHPQWYDVLSLYYKHLFETLPHFEAPFDAAREIMKGKNEAFRRYVEEKTLRDLRNVLGDEAFNAFVIDLEGVNSLHKFIQTRDDETSIHLREDVISKLLATAFLSSEDQELIQDMFGDEYANVAVREYFIYHLSRLRKNVQARFDSYEILSKRVEDTAPMRKLFTEVCKHSEFQVALEEIRARR